MDLETTNKFNKLLTYIRKVAIVVGADVFDPNFEINFRTIFTASMPISLAISYICMLFQKHTLTFVFEGMIMNFLVVQGTTKLFVAVIYAKNFNGLFQRLRNLYENDARLYENQDSLNKCIDYCLLLYKTLAVIYFSVLIMYSSLPILAYIYYDNFQTLFPVHLPYLDAQSTFGFSINIAHQLTFLVLGVIGVLSMDIGFLTLLLHYIPIVNLLRIRLNELNTELVKQPYDLNLVRQQIRSGIVQHQFLTDYINEVNRTCSPILAVQIFSTSGVLILSIFLFVWRKWIAGPCMAFASVFQLSEFCVFGSIILIQNDKVADLIYNISWYLMPVAEQKLVLLMVKRSLYPKALESANFAITVETLMQVLKMTYSFTMMIIEFFN